MLLMITDGQLMIYIYDLQIIRINYAQLAALANLFTDLWLVMNV